MSYCPICRQEFEDYVKKCPDDQVALVAALPAQQAPREPNWSEIAVVGTEDEAKLLQGFLESEGIPASIESLKFTMEPVNFGDMSEIRVYVSTDDRDRAAALLRRREREFAKLDVEGDTVVTDEGSAEIDENIRTEPE